MPRTRSLDPSISIHHRIGYDLRFFRLRAGLTGEQLAPIMGAQRTHVSNYETAKSGWRLQERHAKALDEHFDLPDHFQRLVREASARHSENWFAEHLHVEQAAEELFLAALDVIPGLLQTEAYARRVLTEAGDSPDIEADVAQRMNRQRILDKSKPPLMWALMDESVIRRIVGDRLLMAEQLAKVLEMASRHEISIRIIPFEAGWHPGVSSSFKVMRVNGQMQAYTETTGGGRLLDDPETARTFELRFRRMGEKALSAAASGALITKTMRELCDE
ncbi:helix-turn-helix transcriptional regulator [Actinocorallia aurea]